MPGRARSRTGRLLAALAAAVARRRDRRAASPTPALATDRPAPPCAPVRRVLVRAYRPPLLPEPTGRQPEPAPLDGDASLLVRPYLTAHERDERRTALALTPEPAGTGPWLVHEPLTALPGDGPWPTGSPLGDTPPTGPPLGDARPAGPRPGEGLPPGDGACSAVGLGDTPPAGARPVRRVPACSRRGECAPAASGRGNGPR
ncbi:hypothetical protein [Streptomyces sp. JJ36]|uniref:hypothetical protein n=1 Tax=Streptomyces sp. JJ36 TaxID=2736645 RepID=UPI001F1D10B7|nr:hypothetical protein [Streptomyces sp. JJ36]MCF6526276.1 hypothetical protein [Streptomyces sp. JJ36]